MKLVNKEELIREREEKKRQEEERQRKKRELADAQRARDEQKKIPPEEMFRREAGKYSQFDEQVGHPPGPRAPRVLYGYYTN